MQARKRLIAAAAAAVLLAAWQLHLAAKIGSLFGDFRAFACAGGAIARGADPYSGSVLYGCERSTMPLGLYHAVTGVPVPAPLPGYALLAFVPFGVMPYPAACALWLIVLLVSCVAAVWALARLLGRPLDAAIWALAVGFSVIVIPFGELGSIVLAALLFMALAVRAGAWGWAALAAACAMILPHVALPAMIAGFLFLPRIRIPLAVATAALAALDVLAGGVHRALAYIFVVLPEHARAEIGSTAQYGVTWMLHGLGVTDRLAVAGGEASYAAMAVLGIACARSLFYRTGDAAYVVLLPPAFAMLGGTFVHLTQIMVAIAPALLLYDNARAPVRAAFGAAALLIALPWAWVLGQPLLMVAYAVVAACFARRVLDADVSMSLRVAFAAVLVCAAIVIAGFHFGAGVPAAVHGIAPAQQGLAQGAWGEFIRSQRSSTGPAWWIAKAPTWIGLLLLPLSCAYVLSKKDFVGTVAVEQVPSTS